MTTSEPPRVRRIRPPVVDGRDDRALGAPGGPGDDQRGGLGPAASTSLAASADGNVAVEAGAPAIGLGGAQSGRFDLPSLLPPLLLLAAAAGVAFVVIRPVVSGQVGFDAAASVLYFDRIVAGRHLESFISATPKPLLTVAYGILHALTGDWRPISFVAIAVYAGAVTATTELTRRLAGPVAAGFAAVAFVGTPVLLEDASAAYAVSWALLGWLIAGLALTRLRPRYGIAGLALLLAGLARFETLLLDGLALLVLVAVQLASSHRRTGRHIAAPPGPAWLLLLGFGTLPLQMAHDVLLTGDPFWSERVPSIASAGAPLMTPVATLAWIANHYAPMGPLLLLAVAGIGGLVYRRSWPILVGLVALGPGVLAFLLFLAARSTYISNRYLSPPDLALLFAAAIGLGQLGLSAARGWLPRRDAARGVAGLVAGGLVAAVLVSPLGPLDAGFRRTVTGNRLLFENLDAAHGSLETALFAAAPGPPADPGGAAANGRPALLVPTLLRPRVAVDLGLSLRDVGGLSGRDLTRPGYLVPGQVLYHDPRDDFPADSFRILETDHAVLVGTVLVTPVAIDRVRRTWVLRVTAPSASDGAATRRDGPALAGSLARALGA